MKKLLSVLLCLMLSLCLIFTASAISYEEVTSVSEEVVDSYTTYLEDGSYIVTTITKEIPESNGISTMSTVQTIAGSKKTSHYSEDGEQLYSVTITATFEYDVAASVECVGQTCSTAVYASGYTMKDATATRNNYSNYRVCATASATAVKKVLFVVTDETEITSTINCDYYGNLS